MANTENILTCIKRPQVGMSTQINTRPQPAIDAFYPLDVTASSFRALLGGMSRFSLWYNT